MDPEYRENFELKPEKDIIHVEQDIFPFESVVQQLMQIDKIESPMIKLEHIYKCCTTEI